MLSCNVNKCGHFVDGKSILNVVTLWVERVYCGTRDTMALVGVNAMKLDRVGPVDNRPSTD